MAYVPKVKGGQSYHNPVNRFKNHILKLEKANEMIVDKYEDKYEEYEKANDDLKKQNTELTLNVEELKERLFGKLTMRLKEFATRPDKKKDN